MNDAQLARAVLFEQAVDEFLAQSVEDRVAFAQSLLMQFPEQRVAIELLVRELAGDDDEEYLRAESTLDALPPLPVHVEAFQTKRPELAKDDTKPDVTLLTPVDAASLVSGTPREGSVVVDEVLPRTFGDYELLELIDQGGMGVVYKARSRSLAERLVAIKIIKPEIGGREILARFALECQSLALMHHPSIATVFEGGATEAGDPYLAMELVDGPSLLGYCSSVQLDLRARLSLFAKVCVGIQHAHQKGIIHRDLKPSNILVAEVDGLPLPKIIDFGLAKVDGSASLASSSHTQLGQILGTLHYMSPEAASLLPEAVDTRSDVFSLGVVLFELLTGTTPLDPQLTNDLPIDERLRLVRVQQPSRPSERLRQRVQTSKAESSDSSATAVAIAESREMRGDLDAICMKALASDPDERYGTAAALASDVQNYLDGNPVAAVPASNAYVLAKLAIRYRRVIFVAAAMAAVLLVATGVSVAMALRARAAETLATARLEESLAAQEAEADALQRAERERETALAVNDFLRLDVLAQGSPLVQTNRDVTLREVLDQAASSLNERFLEQPQIKSELSTTVAAVYMDLGEYESAQAFWLEAYELCLEVFDFDDRRTIQIRQGLVENCMYLGQYAQAERLVRINLEALKSTEDQRHHDFVSVQIALASILGSTGRHDQQQEILRSLIESAEDQSRPSVVVVSNLGVSLMSQNNYREALPLLQQSLAQAIEEYGDEHETTLATRGNVSMCLAKNGQFDEAVRLIKRNIVLHEERFGEASPRTLRQRNYLADTLLLSELLEQAEAVGRELLADCQKFGLLVAPSTASIHETYARTLFGLGEDDLAHAALAEFVDLYLEKYGVDDWVGKQALTRAADVLNEEDEHEAARQLVATRWRFSGEQFSVAPKSEEMVLVRQWLTAVRGVRDWESLLRATERLDAILPTDSDSWAIHRAGVQYLQAVAMRRTDRTEESRQMLRECYQTQLKLLGPHHFDTLNSQLQLGLSAIELEQFVEAEEILRSLVEINDDVYDAGNGRGLTAIRGLNKVADYHRAEKNHGEALELYRFMAEFCQAKLGEAHPETLANRNGQGQALRAMGDVASAIDVFVSADALALKPTDVNRSKYCPLLYNWALSLEELERWEEAAELWRRTATELRQQFGTTSYRAERADLHLADVLLELGSTEQAKLVLSELCNIEADTSAKNIVERLEAMDRLIELVDEPELQTLAERLANLFHQSQLFRHMDVWGRSKLALAAAGCFRRLSPEVEQLERALELNQAALKLRVAEDPTHYRTANAYRALGDAYLSLGTAAEAEATWKKAYEIYTLARPMSSGRKRTCDLTVQRLVDLYESQNQVELADQWRQKLASTE